MVAAIPVATTFFFQMATLVRSINTYFGEMIGLLKGERRTRGEQVRMRRQRGPGIQRPVREKQVAEFSLRGSMSRNTDEREGLGELGIVTGQDEDFSQASLKYGTHLTVKWGVDVKKNEVINYARKSCHTRKGVDLQKAQISSLTAQRSGLPLQTQIVHR